MHTSDLSAWQHSHTFLGRTHRRNEGRAWAVMALTAIMMVVELVAGSLFGSMALIADGWHMATHVGALGITALAYFYARRHIDDPAYTFGTGKFGDLAGFSSAVVLAMISLIIAYLSIGRLFAPVAINFDDAILVAAVGLVVNLASAALLHEGRAGDDHAHGHDADHDRDHGHDHGHGHGHPHDQGHDHDRGHGHAAHQAVEREQRHHLRDHNIRSAQLHVLADGLTSFLALVALIGGRSYGWVWLDPLMGIVGSLVIARWSYQLIRDTARVLLDASGSPRLARSIRQAIEESGDDRVADLHLWRVGPGNFAAIVSIVTDRPRPAAEFKKRLRGFGALAHLTVEVNACTTHPA